jgi:hypothetical protein
MTFDVSRSDGVVHAELSLEQKKLITGLIVGGAGSLVVCLVCICRRRLVACGKRVAACFRPPSPESNTRAYSVPRPPPLASAV